MRISKAPLVSKDLSWASSRTTIQASRLSYNLCLCCHGADQPIGSLCSLSRDSVDNGEGPPREGGRPGRRGSVLCHPTTISASRQLSCLIRNSHIHHKLRASVTSTDRGTTFRRGSYLIFPSRVPKKSTQKNMRSTMSCALLLRTTTRRFVTTPSSSSSFASASAEATA